jgi:hypothetical protein
MGVLLSVKSGIKGRIGEKGISKRLSALNPEKYILIFSMNESEWWIKGDILFVL